MSAVKIRATIGREKNSKEIGLRIFCWLPDAHRLIQAARSDTLPVGRPRQGRDWQGMTAIGEDNTPGAHLPHLYCFIYTRRGNTRAIGRPGHGSYLAIMFTKGE